MSARAVRDVGHGLFVLAAGLTQVRRTRGRGPLALASSVGRYGLGFAALGALAARRDPAGIALVDDDGPMTYADLDGAAARVAAGIAVRRGRLGVLCRNGRGFVVALLGAARTGADVVLLDPGLGAPALRDLLERERVGLVLTDGTCPALAAPPHGPPVYDVRPVLDAGSRHPPRSPARRAGPVRRVRPGRLVVLTSGTTGAPRGADRGGVRAAQAVPVTTLVSRIPVRPGRPVVLLPPLFHGYGLGFLAVALAFGMPAVLTARFDAARTTRLLADHPDAVLVAVPPMLDRIVRALPDGARPPVVRAVVSGAGPLHPAVSARVLAAFGAVLFNLYGSTEEGWSTIATPADLLAAPGTIGRPAAGVRVEVLDDGRDAAAAWRPGRQR